MLFWNIKQSKTNIKLITEGIKNEFPEKITKQLKPAIDAYESIKNYDDSDEIKSKHK